MSVSAGVTRFALSRAARAQAVGICALVTGACVLVAIGLGAAGSAIARLMLAYGVRDVMVLDRSIEAMEWLEGMGARRATLETLAFAPLTQTDSSGGVIVTDWYTSPNTPHERVKVTATILDADLRADALRVAASRQILQNGQWIEAPVAAATVQRLEEIILTRARDLRRTAIAG